MQVSFSVNGSREQIDVEPRRTLADALRDNLGLTGTYLGCSRRSRSATGCSAASARRGS